MPKLLLEIGCEELPASACAEAGEQLPRLCREHLNAEPAALYVGPRRLALLVDELPERAPDEVRRGPAERIAFDEDRPTKAAEGFARSAGVRVEELERRDGHAWAHVPGAPIAEHLPDRIAHVVRGLSFAKSMTWGDAGVCRVDDGVYTMLGPSLRFSRPVRWLLAKLGTETVPVAISGQPRLGVSYGHRFTSGEIAVESADHYADTLRLAGVEPDAGERERTIRLGLDDISGWSDPGGVLAEVVHLVESPLVLEGRFDERFLRLPERVIVTAMQSHQRYFPLGGNRFAFVANGGDPETVRAGNEVVLEGRLDDAAFTFDRDVELGLDALVDKLGSITFFEGAGSYADKTERVAGLVVRLGGDEQAAQAARLAKADQASELVREFPDLEGHIGAEYARLAGYSAGVSAAIADQYLPDAAGGPLPQTQAGAILSAADKIDTLNVSFGLGQRPRGSRDPYGLRRAAIGLCRLAFEGGVAIPRELLDDEVRDFVEERFEALLDVPVQFLRAARSAAVPHVGDVARLATTLAGLEGERLERIHTVYTRADRIVSKAKDEELPDHEASLLEEEAEKNVVDVYRRVLAETDDTDDYERVVSAVESLAEPLERFFVEVLVMAEDVNVRRNRLRLLADVRDAIRSRLGHLSEIPQ